MISHSDAPSFPLFCLSCPASPSSLSSPHGLCFSLASCGHFENDLSPSALFSSVSLAYQAPRFPLWSFEDILCHLRISSDATLKVFFLSHSRLSLWTRLSCGSWHSCKLLWSPPWNQTQQSHSPWIYLIDPARFWPTWLSRTSAVFDKLTSNS